VSTAHAIAAPLSRNQDVRMTRRRLKPIMRSVGFPLVVFASTRAAIWVAALFAVLAFEPNRHPRFGNDLDDIGAVIDVWARWDSSWYLNIAEHGYEADPAAPAFFPLYPALMAGLGRILGDEFALAGLLISLTAFAVALVLLHRLAQTLTDPASAARTVVYAALFPMSIFFGAVYTESLYLALCLAACLLAHSRKWLPAGGACGLALLTRSSAVALLAALVLAAILDGNRDLSRKLGGLAAAAISFALYPVYLWATLGDPLAFVDAQRAWDRDLATLGPVGGLAEALAAAFRGLRAVVTNIGTAGPESYWPLHDIETLAYLMVFLALAVVAWRRLGAVYGVFAVVSLGLPVSFPAGDHPLTSLPRYGVVVFPIFIALGTLGRTPNRHTVIVALSAVFLGVATAQWALFQWVA
jgi:Mannosyltransferase (PIG-V)